MVAMRGDSTGQRLIRRLLPVTLGVPVAVGALVLVAMRAGEGETAAVIFGTAVAMIAATAALLSTAASLERRDARRRDTEATLRQANERFTRIFDNAPIGEAIVAPDGTFLQVNRSLCEIVGYEEEELRARTFQAITHPEDLEADLALVRRVLAGEMRSYQMEKRYFHKLGHVVWVMLSVSLVRDDAGEPLYFVSQIEDITDRRHAQAALIESESRLSEAQTIAHIGSWEWRIDEDVVTWSDELYRMFAVEADTPLDYATYLQAVHSDDRSHVEQVVGHALETGQPFTVEHRVLLDDGSTRWVFDRGAVEMVDGKPVRMHGTAQDITEHKTAEVRLAEAELRYRTLVEQLPLVTYVRPLDMADANLYCSPNVVDMLGYTARAWETDPNLLWRIVHPDDLESVAEAGKRVRSTGEPYRGEYRYVASDGRIVWVHDETYLIRDEADVPYAVQGYLFDITERKLAETERDRLQSELFHAQKIDAIGQLAGGVAHEFNNTLTAITAYSNLIREQLELDSPLRSDIEKVIGSAERATSLTRQLLAFGRKQVLQPRALDLNDVVQTSIDLLRPLVHPAIVLTTELAPDLPTTAADPTQIQQVIVNLILNACDATADQSDGTIIVATSHTRIGELSARGHDVDAGDYVVVSVADRGHGMDEATRSRMFEPFFTTKAEGKGTGLGLSTAYGIVRQGGGFLSVLSALGEGTTVAAHLPMREIPVPQPLLRPIEKDPSLPAGIALVVDDEPALREVCAALLERIGYRVRTVGDGDAALASLRVDGPVDLLLTDIVMPGLGGVELGRRVSELYPSTTVVLMSGFPGDLIGDPGDTLFLQKPFGRAELEAITARGSAWAVAAASGERS